MRKEPFTDREERALRNGRFHNRNEGTLGKRRPAQ